MDALYIVRPGNENPELRYSLRSLANVKHGEVWIVGHCPPWVRNVHHVFVPQLDPRRYKYDNNTALIEAICERGPAEFALMNDDFFCVRPSLGFPPPSHRGPLLDLAATRPGSYGMLLRATGMLLREAGLLDPLAYTVHEPLPIELDGFRLAVEYGLRNRAPGDQLSWRSLYGNLARIGGRLKRDVKVHDDVTIPRDDWISTSDCSFKYLRAGEFVRRTLPSPSMYETV